MTKLILAIELIYLCILTKQWFYSVYFNLIVQPSSSLHLGSIELSLSAKVRANMSISNYYFIKIKTRPNHKNAKIPGILRFNFPSEITVILII